MTSSNSQPNGSGTTETTDPLVIGSASSFWLYSKSTGYDLTHPTKPTSEAIQPRITIETLAEGSNTPSPSIAIDPAKTALVIIDMQNFFLSPSFDRKTDGPGHAAMNQLINHAIPTARKAGVRIVWVNWGLTEDEVEKMPSSILRTFGAVRGENGKDASVYVGLGGDTGMREEDGKKVDGGKLLLRDSWNAGLYGALQGMYEEGRDLQDPKRPDVWIHKNRMSALWGETTELESFLEREGIKTLLFTGVNTDQCVGGTMQDAFSKGYDCVLLSDGAGTSSPGFAQDCIEFNARKSWGFVATCEAFAKGVEGMA